MNNIVKIKFIICGYPNLDTTLKEIEKAINDGVDAIELGIPFSDATAESKYIQNAYVEALKNNLSTTKVFAFIDMVRSKYDIPIVLVSYANVVLSYGIEKFALKCQELKIRGVMLHDVPYEESDEFKVPFKKYGITFILTVSSRSYERINKIIENAEGYINVVINPVRDNYDIIYNLIRTLRIKTKLPIVFNLVGVSKTIVDMISTMDIDGVIFE